MWPSFRRCDRSILTVFLKLCHKSLKSLVLGGDPGLADLARLQRCCSLTNLQVLKSFGDRDLTSLIQALPNVTHLRIVGFRSVWLISGLKQLSDKHPQLQSFQFVSNGGVYDLTDILSAWAENGYKPSYLAVMAPLKVFQWEEYMQLYLQKHHCISSFRHPEHLATFAYFQRGNGPLNLTIEAPHLHINLGPNVTPLRAACSTLPAPIGNLSLFLGQSTQGHLVGKAFTQLRQPQLPEELTVPFSQCSPILSYLDLSSATLPVGALQYLSQHCLQLQELLLVHSVVPDLVEGLASLAVGCKQLCGISLNGVSMDLPVGVQPPNLSLWEALCGMPSLTHICVSAAALMPSIRETPKAVQVRSSGSRKRLSHISLLDVEDKEGIRKTLSQLTTVCAVQVQPCSHGHHHPHFAALIHESLLSTISCFQGLRYLNVDFSDAAWGRQKLGCLSSVLRSCPALCYLSITADDLTDLPEDPSLFSRLFQLQLKCGCTVATEGFMNALASAQSLTMLCLQLKVFPFHCVKEILQKLSCLEVCHIVYCCSRLPKNYHLSFKDIAKDFKKCVNTLHRPPLDAFIRRDLSYVCCIHPDLEDLWMC